MKGQMVRTAFYDFAAEDRGATEQKARDWGAFYDARGILHDGQRLLGEHGAIPSAGRGILVWQMIGPWRAPVVTETTDGR